MDYMLALEQSWRRIFELDMEFPDGWRHPPHKRAVQGCVWEIRLEHVRKVTSFKGARKPKP
jgi:hypothetical protein